MGYRKKIRNRFELGMNNTMLRSKLNSINLYIKVQDNLSIRLSFSLHHSFFS